MNRRYHSPRKHIMSILLAVLVVLVLVPTVGPRLVQATPSAQQELRDVWQRVQLSGAYSFGARITQTLTPRATMVNAGRDQQVTQMYMEGQTDLNAESMQLNVWTNGGSVLDSDTSLQLKVEAGKAYMRQGGGTWEPTDDITGLFAPSGDFLAQVETAKNVERHSPEMRDTVGGRMLVTRYTYEVDGRRFAAKVRTQMMEQAAKEGMPAGMQVELPRVYVDMTGWGELWVGADGLPLRLTYSLQFPERDDNYQPNVDATVNFFDFNPQPLASFRGQAAYIGHNLMQAAQHPGNMARALLGPLALLFTLAVIHYRRSRRVYATLVISIIVSMLAMPLLNSERAYAFSSRLAERSSEQEKMRAEQQATRALQAEMNKPSINPHLDPLARADMSLYAQATADTTADKYFAPECTSDPDGDLDGDSLTNLQECLIGTQPRMFDTDGDTINDYLEVIGFQIPGSDETWYTDPLYQDSNRDGLDDGSEWLVGYDGTTPPDTDGDGVPNLWDDDNDNDGVPDGTDLSPYASSVDQSPFNEDAPFTLEINDLVTDVLVKVEFQLRPTNADHLWLINNVLDWPDNDDEGQIQDVDGKTFFDVNPSLDASPNANGDLRMVPMLEITMPISPSNLPSEELRTQFGIAVQQISENTQAAYVPLQLVTDDLGAQNVAFSGTMFYRAAAEWGDAQSVRLVWGVQGLVDQCQTVEDGECTSYLYNQEQLLHIYDDSWYLTGLNVTEEHDSQVAVVSEDPSQTAQLMPNDDRPLYMDALYALADGLDRTFMAGIDCDSVDANGYCVGDGELDWSVDTIVARFDHTTNGTISSADRFELPNVFDAVKVQNESPELAMLQVTVTETQRILTENFTPAWSEASPITPTILFANQNQIRALNLNEGVTTNGSTNGDRVVWTGSNLALTLPQGGESPLELNTTMGMTWSPYAYDPAIGWQPADINTFWDEMNVQLGDGFVGNLPEDGKHTFQTMAQVAYLTLYQGMVRTVQVGDLILASTTIPVEDTFGTIVAVMNEEYLSRLTQLYYDWTPQLEAAARRLNPQLFKLDVLKVNVIFSASVQLLKDLYVISMDARTYARAINTTPLTEEQLRALLSFPGEDLKGGLGDMVRPGRPQNDNIDNLGSIDDINDIDAPKNPNPSSPLQDSLAGNGDPDEAPQPTSSPSSTTFWSAVIIVVVMALYIAFIVLEVLQLTGTLDLGVDIAGILLVVVLTFSVLSQIITLVSAVTAAIAGQVSFLQAMSSYFATLTAGSRLTLGIMAGIGLMIQIGVALGIFFYLWDSGRIKQGTVEFNYTLGYTISAIIVAVALFIFTVATAGVGGILLLLVASVDAWLRVFGVDFQIIGALTDLLASWAYQYELSGKPKVDTGALGLDLVDPNRGLVAGNGIVVSLLVTTSIGGTGATSNSFVYALNGGEGKLSTGSDERKDDWIIGLEGSDAKATLIDNPMVTTTLTAEVNYRPITLTLQSAYALRGKSCWFSICSIKFIKGSDSANAGAGIVLDVFPATLKEFLNVNTWGTVEQRLRFPDRDGDGLLPFSLGGVDPDETTWDADGDGLSDTFELNSRSSTSTGSTIYLNPLAADTDGDGILDAEELRLGSNPGASDTDGDGLADVEELPPFGGWMVPYAPDKYARIWSSPYDADGDGDGLSDLFERTQVTCPDCDPWAEDDPIIYNPNVWNPNPVPLYVDDNTVNGYVKPGATVVYTTTTGNNLVGGQELAGRVSMAPLGGFSGAPLAADVAVSSGESQSLVSVLTAGSQPGTFTLESQMALTDYDVTVWTKQRTITNSVATVAGDNALAFAGATPTGWPAPYLLVSQERASDGVETITAYIARADSQVLDATILYTGTAGSTLTAPTVSCMTDGTCLAIWGVNDASGMGSIVGTQLYQDISNPATKVVWSQASSTVTLPNVGSDGNDFLVVWLADAGSGKQVWVQAEPSGLDATVAPTALAGPSAAYSGLTTSWNGVNYDVIWSDNGQLQRAQVDHQGQLVNAAVGLGTGSGWPTSAGGENPPILVFDPGSQQSLLLYRNTDGGVSLDALLLSAVGVVDSFTLDSAASLSGNNAAVALCADPVNSGWVASWSQPGVAEILFQALAPDGTLRGSRNSESSTNVDPALVLVCSQPQPVLELSFEEPADSTFFADSSGYGNNVFCSDDLCPLSGVDGRVGNGVNLDGTNDELSLRFQQSDGAFSTDLWLRTTKQSSEILLRQDEFERIYMDNGKLCAWVQTTAGADTICTQDGTNYADGLWHHTAHVSDGALHQLYVNGELEATSSTLGTLDFCTNETSACQNFTLGRANSYGSVYQGDMDEVHYHDRALTGAEVADIFEAALAVYQLDEVSGLTSFRDSSDNDFTATCSSAGCPALGVEGMAYTAAEFDGTDDVLTVDTVAKVNAIYAYDFNGASTAGVPPEWTPSGTQANNFFRNDEPEEFLGFMNNNERAELTLSNLPPHDTIEITFDLYLFGQWDGNQTRLGTDDSGGLVVGPDQWMFGYDSTELFRSTFATNLRPGGYQAYPRKYPTSFRGVTLYGDSNCENRETPITQDTPDLHRAELGDDTVGNDNASCIWFPGTKDTVAILYQSINYQGDTWIQDPKGGVTETGWNNDVSSVAVWSAGYAPNYGASGDRLRVGNGNVANAIYPIKRSFSHTNNAITLYFQSLTEGSSVFALDNVVVKLTSKESSIPLANSSFTLSAWAKRASSGTEDYILSQGTAASNQGLHFGFRHTNRFTCAFYGNDLNSSATYTDNEWHHWACTYDAETNLRTLYRDGVQVAQDTASADYTGIGPTSIGSRFDQTDYFHGTLDEVAVWPTVLNADQIAELYAKVKAQDETVMVGLSPEVAAQPEVDMSSFTLRETTTQLGVVRQTISRTLTIDDDAPATTISSPAAGAYVDGDGTLSISGSASDPTSYVAQVAVQVGDGGAQVATGTEAWTYNLDSSTLDEGSVSVSAQATDAVGTTGPTATQNFIVDRTPPTVTLNQNGVLHPTRNAAGSWIVSLDGTATDPNAGAEPGSGVASVEVLVQADAPLAGNGWQSANVTADSWSLDYLLPPLEVANPTGVFTFTLRATDGVSNTTAPSSLVRVLTLDATGPALTLNVPLSTTDVLSTQITFSGQALDANPVVAVEVNLNPAEQIAALDEAILYLSFDDTEAQAFYADQSGANNAAVCEQETCPQPDQAGQRGNAVAFEMGQQLSVDGIDLANSSFSIGAWVQRTTTGTAAEILGQESANQGLTFGFLSDNTFRCGFGENNLTTAQAYDLPGWQHWVCTYDGDSGLRTLYLNGTEVAQDTLTTAYQGTGIVNIGSAEFAGLLDEVVVYARALAPYEVGDLYEYGVTTWTTATLSGSATNPTWSYTLPSGENGLEGIFQLNVRAIDALGNVTPQGEQRLWRGVIDTLPPRMQFNRTFDDSGTLHSTTFTCVARDYNIFVGNTCRPITAEPAAQYRNGDITWTNYSEFNPWYSTVVTSSRPYQVEGSRIYSGTLTGSGAIESCDSVGNCATIEVEDVVASAEVAAAGVAQLVELTEILEPSSGTVLTTLDPIVVIGDAIDEDGLHNLHVHVNNAPVYSKSWAQEEIVTSDWSFTWTPPAEGIYTFHSFLSEGNAEEYAELSSAEEPSEPVARKGETAANDATNQLYMPRAYGQGDKTYLTYLTQIYQDLQWQDVVSSTSTITVYVDMTPPAVEVEPLELSSDQALGERAILLTGVVTDNVRLHVVNVRLEDGIWQHADVKDDGTWQIALLLADAPDGESYEVTVEAVDVAGFTTTVTRTIYVDSVAPVAGEIELYYRTATDDLVVAEPGDVISGAVSLELHWTAGSDGGGEVEYHAGFTPALTLNEESLVMKGEEDVHHQLVSSGEQWYAHLRLVDTRGNQETITLGPFTIK